MVEFTLIENNKLNCSFAGPLNSDACQKLSEEISKKLGESKISQIIFDLKKVEYIASAFLRICQTCYKEYGKENFSIINVSPSIKKVFKVTGFEKFMDIS